MTTDPVTGQTTYEVRQGSKRLELVVGSMALQVSKGGKPVESILYKDMVGWQDDAGILTIEVEEEAAKRMYSTPASGAEDFLLGQQPPVRGARE